MCPQMVVMVETWMRKANSRAECLCPTEETSLPFPYGKGPIVNQLPGVWLIPPKTVSYQFRADVYCRQALSSGVSQVSLLRGSPRC